MKKYVIIIAVLVLPVLLFLSGFMFIVKETEYVVITRLGDVRTIHSEPGIKFKIPLLEKYTPYSAQILTIDSSAENITTGDGKKLIVNTNIKWKITNPEIFRNSLSTIEKAHNHISILTHNALKNIMSTYPLLKIISTERDTITKIALASAQKEADKLGLRVVDVTIKKIEFSEATVLKTYDRMKEERYKEAHYYRSRGEEESLRIMAETDKEAAIIKSTANRTAKMIRAKAEGTIAGIYANAYNVDPEFYAFYRSLQTLKVTIDSSTTLVISPRSELYKYLVGN